MWPSASMRASPIALFARWYQTGVPVASTAIRYPRNGAVAPVLGGSPRRVASNSVTPGDIRVGSLVTLRGGRSDGSAPVWDGTLRDVTDAPPLATAVTHSV